MENLAERMDKDCVFIDDKQACNGYPYPTAGNIVRVDGDYYSSV